MAESILGLDVGTSAVRVVEVVVRDAGRSVASGARPLIRVVGQVPLPLGAVREGEVIDPAAVGQAIVQLWRETGLTRRDVRVGLAGQRVVVRVVELPAMPEAELAGAVRFTAQEHISMPLDEAVLDFAVLESLPDGGAQGAGLRVLLVAAHREPIDRLLQAVTAGGLRALAVDLVPFALIRGLMGELDAGAPSTEAQAVVSIGAGVTTVVVHETGRPRFVRMVAMGGQALTAAVADSLGMSLEAAEEAKCAAGSNGVDFQAAEVIESHLGTVLGEIHGSLNYWMAQSDRPLARVVLTGGGVAAGELRGRLVSLLGVSVDPTHPSEQFDVKTAPDAGENLEPFLVAAGLALGAVRSQPPRIDLRPTDPGSSTRSIIRRVLPVGAALVLLLGGLTVSRAAALRGERGRLAAQQVTNRATDMEIQKLAKVHELRTTLDAGQGRVQAALAGDVAWARLLEGLAQSMPEGVWLQSFSAQAASPVSATVSGANSSNLAATPAGVAPSPLGAGGGGTVSFTAAGRDYPSVASWLERVSGQAGLSNSVFTSLTKSALGEHSIVNFSATAQLNEEARASRAEHLMEETR